MCWDYALAWQKEASRLSRAGVACPLFISVGQPEQLQQFLDVNPELSGAKALIDDSKTFEGYKSAGFNILRGDQTLEKPPDFKPPKTMSLGKWLSYLKNVASLSPVPKGMRLGEVPQGVRVLGGTYAIEDSAVRFSHNDVVPGATPEIDAVLKAVGA